MIDKQEAAIFKLKQDLNQNKEKILEYIKYCYIVGLGLNCKFIDLLFKRSVLKFIKISSFIVFIVLKIIYNQTDTLTQRLIHQRQF